MTAIRDDHEVSDHGKSGRFLQLARPRPRPSEHMSRLAACTEHAHRAGRILQGEHVPRSIDIDVDDAVEEWATFVPSDHEIFL